MSTSPEDDRRDAETNRIAAEGSRIGGESDRVTAEGKRVQADSKRVLANARTVSRRMRIDFAQVLAYLLIIAVAIFSFQRIEQVVERNATLVNCLTEWVIANTDALQDRDAVNKTANAAEKEMWHRLHNYLSTPQTSRKPMLRAIQQYQTVLDRLSNQESINPYPTIAGCLRQEEASALTLVASLSGKKCFGRQPTIFGTSGDDTIQGTDGPDVIRAKGGNDLIVAGQGVDRICAGRGDDTINGGQHFDRARGGNGFDLCIQVEFTRSCR